MPRDYFFDSSSYCPRPQRYLYRPIERGDDDPAWTFDAWAWMLREGLGLSSQSHAWLTRPAMMRVTLSTPLVLDRLKRARRVLRGDDDPAWTFDAWAWMLREGLGLSSQSHAWLARPAMMRVTLSTPLVLDRLNRETRPHNFLFCPLVDPVVGYPAGVDRDRFTLIAPFAKRSTDWLQLPCINVHDGRSYRLALQQTTDSIASFRKRLRQFCVCI